MKFNLGQIVVTRSVADLIADNAAARVIQSILSRHAACDFGDLCPSDKALNVAALKDGGRVLSAYETGHGNFYVITEWDRSVTTILFKNEY